MGMEEIVNLATQAGLSVVIILYFLYKDYKFNENIITVLNEVKCPCCGECLIGPETLEMAEKIRAHFGGRPYTVSSGYRCKKHNREVGGVANSRHTTGKAMDGTISGVRAAEAVKAAYELGCRYAYAIDSNYFHFDIK